MQHVNTRYDTVVGLIFLILIVVAAVASFPLMILTHSGQPRNYAPRDAVKCEARGMESALEL